MKMYLAFISSLVYFSAAAFGQTTILWNESVNGHLSGNSSTFSFQLGTNIIIGATEVEQTGNNWFVHPDYFTFEVPNDSEVTAIYILIDKPLVWTWIGDPTFSSELAYTLNTSPGELLSQSQWGLSSISADTYGMYLSNHDHSSPLSIANYELDFVVEPLPEPSPVGLLLLGTCVFILRSCRQSRLLTSQPT